MDNKFKYEVHPRIPIRTLIPQQAIFRPTQLDLTKEEVKLCLKHGPVYRVFDRSTQVQATLYNLDELHVEKYNAPKDNGAIDPAKKTTVCETIVVPKKEEAPAPVVEEPVPVAEPVIPEVVEEAPVEESAPVEEPVVEEPAPVAEPIPEISNLVEDKPAPVVEEAAPEAPVEEPSEEVEAVEAPAEENVEEATEEADEESVEADEEDEEDDVEEEEEAPTEGQQPGNQYHPQRKKKKHH